MLLMTNMFLDHWFMFGSILKIIILIALMAIKLDYCSLSIKNELSNMQEPVNISMK